MHLTSKESAAEPPKDERDRKDWNERLAALKRGKRSILIDASGLLSKYPGRRKMMEEIETRRVEKASRIAAFMAKQEEKPKLLSGLQLMRTRPHLMDPLLFDAKDVMPLDIPCANARVTARALSALIHAVSRNSVVKPSLLAAACRPVTRDSNVEAWIATGGLPPLFGLGYQLLPLKRSSLPAPQCASYNLETSLSPDLTVASGLPATRASSLMTTAAIPSVVAPPNTRVSRTVLKPKRAAHAKRPAPSGCHINLHSLSSGDDMIYGFGGSDMNGNMIFSVTECELSVCILVNDSVKGSRTSQRVLSMVLEAFGLEVRAG